MCSCLAGWKTKHRNELRPVKRTWMPISFVPPGAGYSPVQSIYSREGSEGHQCWRMDFNKMFPADFLRSSQTFVLQTNGPKVEQIDSVADVVWPLFSAWSLLVFQPAWEQGHKLWIIFVLLKINSSAAFTASVLQMIILMVFCKLFYFFLLLGLFYLTNYDV